MNTQLKPIPGRPRLAVALVLGVVLITLIGHLWWVPALTNYVDVAACTRWFGLNGLSALLILITTGAGAGVLAFGLLASRYWRRIEQSGQIPPPGALVLRTTQPRRLEEIPARARLARWLPHFGGVVMALCLVMGIALHYKLVAPSLDALIERCQETSATP